MNTRNAIRQLLMSLCIMILAPSVNAAAVYWNLFNAEGESAADAVFVTYATLGDMLNDTNRTGSGVPDGFGAAVNVVGSGSDGHTYWNLFNAEGENAADAVFITYATLSDMLNDTNRTGSGVPDGFGAAVNVVGSGSDGTNYWNLFNAEGESAADAVYITYATLNDMLNDTNRTGSGVPDGFGAGVNVVGSGSDGHTFWSLFNAEGENAADAVFVTYATLGDMLNDTNRTGSGVPDGFGAAVNVVGSGSDGTNYWNLFNAEGESAADAVFITYATLNDMLNDTNRTGSGVPDGFGAGVNVVGSGAFVIPEPPVSVPEPSVISLIMAALALMFCSTKARCRPGLNVVRIGRT